METQRDLTLLKYADVLLGRADCYLYSMRDNAFAHVLYLQSCSTKILPLDEQRRVIADLIGWQASLQGVLDLHEQVRRARTSESAQRLARAIEFAVSYCAFDAVMGDRYRVVVEGSTLDSDCRRFLARIARTTYGAQLSD